MLKILFRARFKKEKKEWVVYNSTALLNRLIDCQGLFSPSLVNDFWFTVEQNQIRETLDLLKYFDPNSNKYQLFPTRKEDLNSFEFALELDHDRNVYLQNIPIIKNTLSSIIEFSEKRISFWHDVKIEALVTQV